jgi:hypothetical protein
MRVPKTVVIGGVALAIGAGAAFALWNANAGGTAGSKAVTAQTITVTASTGAADLYPGFTQGDLYFTMANTNPYAVTFTAMTAGTVTSSSPTNCPASNVTVANASGLSLPLPSGATNTAGAIANVVSMATAATDGCQGVSFTIDLTLTGLQS